MYSALGTDNERDTLLCDETLWAESWFDAWDIEPSWMILPGGLDPAPGGEHWEYQRSRTNVMTGDAIHYFRHGNHPSNNDIMYVEILDTEAGKVSILRSYDPD